MKTVIAILLLLILIPVAYFFYLGKKSGNGEAPGLIDNQLARCPETPNCVCTEYSDDKAHYIEPLENAGSVNDIVKAIHALGGQVSNQSDGYISAIFVSRVFGFVDDVEFRIDFEKEEIHIRSASRVGRSDLGVNKQRVDRIKEFLHGVE